MSASAEFTCSLKQDPLPFDHFWEHTVGSGYAPLALRGDWQAQLARCREELGFRRVRFHGLLSDDMGTLVNHAGELLYSFFNADQVFDFLLSIGMRPFVELSFMPRALASGEKTVFSYAENVTPPEDHEKWANFIMKLVRHWVHRYGRSEVRQWYFEVWNEPNLHHFWTGSREDYFRFYRITAEAIRSVDGSLRVGGPATAQNEWIPEFLDYCGEHGLPADFVSTHHYPTDAFGEEGDDTVTVLSKSERSVLRKEAAAAKEQAGGKPLFYTEWNSSSNPRDRLHDDPWSATFIIKTIMEAEGLVDCYSFWTFSDIFRENYFPSVPFHGGFGLLTLHGIPKPSYRAYQLLHRLGDERLECSGSHGTVDMWTVRDGNRVTVVLTNHALPRHPIEEVAVEIRLSGTPPPRSVRICRIDGYNANPRRIWEQMGEPDYLGPSDVETLKAASRSLPQSLPAEHSEGTIRLNADLPPHGSAFIDVEFDA